MAARIDPVKYNPGSGNGGVPRKSQYSAGLPTPESSRWEGIQATGDSRQHNGHQYNSNTINNYAPAIPYSNAPVKSPDDPIRIDLMRACREGQGPRRLGFLLSRGANLEHRDQQQETPLHHAASSGSVPTLSYLVDAGADVHAYGERTGTPLHHAASSGSTEAVQFLLDAGAEADSTDEWIGTPLHNAAFGGSADVVRCLLEAGADIHSFGRWVGTPLSIAAARSYLAVVEVLIEFMVDVDQHCEHFGSAAHMACASGNVEILRLLHQEGADLGGNPEGRGTKTCHAIYGDILESESRSLPRSLGSCPLQGKAVFHSFPGILAIYHGNVEAARFCLDLFGLRPHEAFSTTWFTLDNWRRPSHWTQLSINLAVAALDIDMLRLLLDSRVDPKKNFIKPPMSYIGSSKTLKASTNGANASACISLLLQHGAHNSCLDIDKWGGRTLLMKILHDSDDSVMCDVAKAILDHGGVVNAADHRGQTPLMIAAGTDRKSRVRCVELLCEYGANVDAEDQDGRTALRYAEKWGGSQDYLEVRRVLERFSKNGHDRSSSEDIARSSASQDVRHFLHVPKGGRFLPTPRPEHEHSFRPGI